jgi:hypothetical protein
VQLPVAPMTSEKKPVVGHAATHSLLCRNGVDGFVQLRHSVLLGPLHVPHEPSHASHTPLPFAHFPVGVHEARQLPGGSKKGVTEAHVLHSVAAAPKHVEQLASHVTQVSASVELPPEHVKPSSMWEQSALQPSVPIVLPSSHASFPTRFPSPQTAVHESIELIVPPEQTNPASIWQSVLQPSPGAVLLSSHCSALFQRIRMPSPQMGAQVSTPPIPEPSVFDDVHAKPVSMRQSESQPSPPTVLLSSQNSAVDRFPLPQTCTGGT